MLELKPETRCCSRAVAALPAAASAARLVATTEAWRRGGEEE